MKNKQFLCSYISHRGTCRERERRRTFEVIMIMTMLMLTLMSMSMISYQSVNDYREERRILEA